MKQSLGMIEVKGFAETVKISDVMSKVANIRLISTKMTRGGGWMSIFIEGDVGAVNAAIQAGTTEAKANGSFISSKVIPRPSSGLAMMFYDEESVEKVSEEVKSDGETQEGEVTEKSEEAEPEQVKGSEVIEETVTVEPVDETISEQTELLATEEKQPTEENLEEKPKKTSKARTKKSKK